MKILNEYEVEGIEDFCAGLSNIVNVYYDGNEVASYTFECHPNEEGDIILVVPHLANVSPEYRGKGISTEIIRIIHQDYDVRFDNTVNNVVEDKNDIHYSDEGLRWMEKCYLLGYARRDDDCSDDD